MRRTTIILIILITTFSAAAQQKGPRSAEKANCALRLKEAETLYQGGYYPDCIKILEDITTSCRLTKNEKTRALEILGNAYLEINDPGKAESAVNLLLVNSPHYELNEDANSESFNRLVKKYEIHPLVTLGAKNAADFLRHKVTKTYSVLDGLDYGDKFNESGYFLTYYGMAEFEFRKDLAFTGDLMFFWSSFERNISKSPGFSLNYWEKDWFAQLPLYLKKYWEVRKNLYVYGSGGVGIMYLYKAQGNISLSYTKDDVITGKNADFTGVISPINVLPMRNQLLPQWNLGAGIGYKIRNLRMFLDARYLGDIGNVTAPEKAGNIAVLKDDYFYIDNAWKLNQFELGATISYTLFNSVKRIRK